MSSFISAGYLPCVTMSKYKTSVEHSSFQHMQQNVFDNISSGSPSEMSDREEGEDLKYKRSPKLTTYDDVSELVSLYIGNIKGI
jgi:hypothetical protein